MALRYSEDTEFNAALRERGILPPKPPSRSPSPDHPAPLTTSDRLNQISDEDEFDELDDPEFDDIPPSIIEKWKAQKMKEAQRMKGFGRFGDMRPIGREDYKREVTEASKVDVGAGEEGEEDRESDGKWKGKGTGVICFLFKDSIPESNHLRALLSRLAPLYPASKFVSIPGNMCIENYPDRNIPTLLVYRGGDVVRQTIGLGPELGLKGMKTSLEDVENLLLSCGALDEQLRDGSAGARRNGDRDEEDEDEEDSWASKTGVSNGIRNGFGGGGRDERRGDEDDEFDL